MDLNNKKLKLIIRNLLNEVIEEGSRTIGYSNPKATISQEIYYQLQSLIGKDDFIDSDVGDANISYKQNYNDLDFNLFVSKPKKDFSDGSQYSRSVYLVLDFDEFGNAKDLVKKAFKEKTSGSANYFNSKDNSINIGIIKYTPRTDEIDYKKDYVESSIGNIIKITDSIYKKYPQLLNPGFNKINEETESVQSETFDFSQKNIGEPISIKFRDVELIVEKIGDNLFEVANSGDSTKLKVGDILKIKDSQIVNIGDSMEFEIFRKTNVEYKSDPIKEIK